MKIQIIAITSIVVLGISWVTTRLLTDEGTFVVLNVIKEEKVELVSGENFDQFEGPEFKIERDYFGEKVPKELTKMDEELVNFEDVINYLLKINERRGYGYYHVGQEMGTVHNYLYDMHEEGDHGYDWDKVEAFRGYYKKLFKSEIARKAMFAYLKPVLQKMANEYPKDWNTMVLQQLDETIEFTKSYDPDEELEETGYSFDTHGRSYFEGFIARRIKNDGVPKVELLGYLTEVQTMIQNTVTKSNYNAAITYIFNNEMTVTRGAGQFLIQSKNGQRYIVDNVQNMKYYDNGGVHTYEFFERWNSEEADVVIEI